MRLTIKYFGMLAEAANCDNEELEVAGEAVSNLIEAVHQKYPATKEMNFMVAVNQSVVKENMVIDPAAEIALLPQFAGG